MTKAKPDAPPPLVVLAPREVPMTVEQERRAFEALKALCLRYLRAERAGAGRLDNRYQIEPSSLPHEGPKEEP
jgi:hypothetical protein